MVLREAPPTSQELHIQLNKEEMCQATATLLTIFRVLPKAADVVIQPTAPGATECRASDFLKYLNTGF